MKDRDQALIEFIPGKPEYEGVFDPPIPASQVLPGWYKRQSLYTDGDQRINDRTGDANHTVKACMPALDAMCAGYIIPLPQEVRIVAENGLVNSLWPSEIINQISSHGIGQVNELPIDESVWEPAPLKFVNPWIIKTPPGYSTLFTTPMWQEDLPFYCFPGVVDTDHYNFSPVNFPFLIRRGFSGIIECGTPMIQAIPFKRTVFSSIVHEKHDPRSNAAWQRARRYFAHRYKRSCRQKKEYR